MQQDLKDVKYAQSQQSSILKSKDEIEELNDLEDIGGGIDDKIDD